MAKRSDHGMTRRELLRAGVYGGAVLAAAPWLPLRAEEPMHRRTIPSSGERLPVIGLGTARTFDVASGSGAEEDLRTVMQRFFDLGGRVVDTSPMYGRAESVIGELGRSLGLVDELFLATKVWTRGREAGIEQMHRSARRLETRVIDLMQVHNLVDVQTQLKTLRRMKEGGFVRYIGITHYTVSAHDDLMRLMRSEPLDFVQFNFNIAVRAAETDLLPLAAERGIATLVNGPFDSGALFRRVRGRRLPGWVEDIGCGSWAQFFLKYIVAHPAVTCAIPATGDPAHAADNTRAGYGVLPDAGQRRRMVAYFEGL